MLLSGSRVAYESEIDSESGQDLKDTGSWGRRSSRSGGGYPICEGSHGSVVLFADVWTC